MQSQSQRLDKKKNRNLTNQNGVNQTSKIPKEESEASKKKIGHQSREDMSSKPTWVAIEPAELRFGPFLGAGMYQIFQRYIINKGVDISVMDLGDNQWSPTGKDLDDIKRMRCCNIWNNSISKPEPRETFG